ncbi:hypothetical protein R0135_00580 [Congregibacter variabilis]|uniref:Phage terminase-like protein, large subunit, contains N-terminal HTH domain n=1 Tax=Congregibacter variabilis TaxID=3081200 RepID=A0ABZ0I4Z0_9GAMM|nr:hypothetical protein R0135_00580 [Congregibacter sp. IMCC43200]
MGGITIIDLMTDPQLFGKQFRGPSFEAWRVLLAGFYGLPLTDEQAVVWHELTGRDKPAGPHDELWQAIGRRGGKTQIAALLAVYEACFRDHAPKLSPGEVATVMCIAADRKQSRSLMRYIVGLMESNPMLKRLIVRQDRESLELSNRCVIEIAAASFRSVRGYTLRAVLCDEIAFWRSDESANPDSEIIAALRPALATLNGPLIALSSPYAKRGELWHNYRRHFATDSPVLVAQAPSRTMNPGLPQRVVDAAKDRDPVAAASEYGAEFRSDIQSFIDPVLLDSLTRSEPAVLPPAPGIKYTAFADPSGGGPDGFSLAICHRERDTVIVDLVTERTRTNPASVVSEYCKILQQYRIQVVGGDKYAGQWVANEFSRHGVRYNYSAKNRSELYIDTLAMLNAGEVELPPVDKLARQFANLERRTSRSGRDSIDHPPGLHDDLANAVAGAVVSQQKDRQCITPIFGQVRTL